MLDKKWMNIVVPMILFIILAPGLILSIPPTSNGLFATGEVNISSVIVHAIVFAVIYYFLREKFSQYY